MIEKRSEFYSVNEWRDDVNKYLEMFCGDDLDEMTKIYNRIRETHPEIKIRLTKLIHIERDSCETILSSM